VGDNLLLIRATRLRPCNTGGNYYWAAFGHRRTFRTRERFGEHLESRHAAGVTEDRGITSSSTPVRFFDQPLWSVPDSEVGVLNWNPDLRRLPSMSRYCPTTPGTIYRGRDAVNR
jgi:hypothetical protein